MELLAFKESTKKLAHLSDSLSERLSKDLSAGSDLKSLEDLLSNLEKELQFVLKSPRLDEAIADQAPALKKSYATVFDNICAMSKIVFRSLMAEAPEADGEFLAACVSFLESIGELSAWHECTWSIASRKDQYYDMLVLHKRLPYLRVIEKGSGDLELGKDMVCGALSHFNIAVHMTIQRLEPTMGSQSEASEVLEFVAESGEKNRAKLIGKMLSWLEDDVKEELDAVRNSFAGMQFGAIELHRTRARSLSAMPWD